MSTTITGKEKVCMCKASVACSANKRSGPIRGGNT